MVSGLTTLIVCLDKSLISLFNLSFFNQILVEVKKRKSLENILDVKVKVKAEIAEYKEKLKVARAQISEYKNQLAIVNQPTQ